MEGRTTKQSSNKVSCAEKNDMSAACWALLCSVMIGIAQLVLKAAAGHVQNSDFLNPHLPLLFVTAFSILGLAFVVLLLAFRHGALSFVYPILAARYVWVVGVAPLLFASESWNVNKILGSLAVALGVAMVARGRVN